MIASVVAPNIRPPAAAPPAVEAGDLHKSFRRGNSVTHVLQGVDLVVEQGEFTLLVGPSGSGKSTLLSILGCLLPPDRGWLALGGQAVAASERQSLRRDRIGFVFQGFRLVRGLSALDNVCVPLMIRGEPAEGSRQRACQLLEQVALADVQSAPIEQLSAGQCQRVALARALAGDPELILADEPTAALDAAAGRQIMELLRELAGQYGKTAIVVTHDPRIVEFADRIYEMDQGRLTERSASRR